MKSSLTRTFGIAFGTLCLMISAQVVSAQSGNRNDGFQQSQTIPQQRSEAAPFASQSQEFARVGFEQYDHRTLDALLQKYVDQNGNVDYATWQTNQQDRATLMGYLRGMNSLDPSLNALSLIHI